MNGVATGAGVATAGVIFLLLSGCQDANVHDYKGVHYQHPDTIKVWDNIDEHPNIARLCLDGVAFATTSRNLDAVTRVPEWDHLCPAAGAK